MVWVALVIGWVVVVGVLLCACRMAAAADGSIPAPADLAPEPAVAGPGAPMPA